MTTAAASQQQGSVTSERTNTYLFTLKFAGGQVAPLEVRGAHDQNAARIIAQTAIAPCRYDVVDGDLTGGQAECFYLWCSAAAQERQPLHPRFQKQEERHDVVQLDEEEGQQGYDSQQEVTTCLLCGQETTILSCIMVIENAGLSGWPVECCPECKDSIKRCNAQQQRQRTRQETSC